MLKSMEHLKTINNHKKLVMQSCFRVGLYRQGLLHDLSKYMPSEFFVGCKYYQGTMSPNNMERKVKGYSSAWLHHKGRNKHHLEYWIDYAIPVERDGKLEHGGICGMKMPVRYVVEMFIDRMSASKNYQKEKYSQESPLGYYNKGKEQYILHEDTRALLELLLVMLSVRGEAAVFRFIRQRLLRGKVPYEKRKLDSARKKLETEGRRIRQ